jgi:hypothetical protein
MRNDDVIALLREVVAGLTETAEGAAQRLWRIAPDGAGFTGATIRLDERWITFSAESAVHGDVASDPLRILGVQSTLPGNARIVRRCGHLDLRTEMPIPDATAAARDWMRRQVALACAGLGATLRQEGAAWREAEGTGFDAHAIAQRCSAGGWRASLGRDCEVRVEFMARCVFRVAVLTGHGGAIRVAVTLETGAPASQGPQSRSAVAAFLLRATRSLKWVRAFGTAGDEAPAAIGFECQLAVPADDQPLVLALDAIATACELYGREAEALAGDALLAGRYLGLERDAGAHVANEPLDSVSAAAVPAHGGDVVTARPLHERR